jgi:hypothetical protein
MALLSCQYKSSIESFQKQGYIRTLKLPLRFYSVATKTTATLFVIAFMKARD